MYNQSVNLKSLDIIARHCKVIIFQKCLSVNNHKYLYEKYLARGQITSFYSWIPNGP